jgi:anti-sigma factor RsiW
MKACREIYQHICDNLDEDLSSPRCKQIKRHIDACPDCRAYLDSLKKTVILYRKLPVPPVSRSAHANLLKSIRLEISGVENKKTRRGGSKRRS